METTTQTKMQLSPDQQHAHDAVVAWYRAKSKPLLTLGGYAGTGKTTLTAAIAASLRAQHKKLTVAYVCFTGKAASVLKVKLDRAKALRPGEHCGTIHSLIYKPKYDLHHRIVGWERAPALPADLVVLDEASMVDEVLFKDLAGYGVPILAVGDHGQLPPIKEGFNLMAEPELRLEQIHRQALDNPILKASMLVRNGTPIPACNWEDKFIKAPDASILQDLPNLRDTLFISGTNRTRVALNHKIRGKLGYTEKGPMVGERVICLKNNRNLGIYNGMTGVLKSVKDEGEHHYRTELAMDGLPGLLRESISKHQFGSLVTLKGGEPNVPDWRSLGQLFDWGYAMTAHKAQGSEAAQVVVYDECDWMKEEDLKRRWRYTAYTRASARLIVIGQ